MKFFDFTDPFYAPAWIRICIVGVCVGWGVFELAMGQSIWGIIFIALGAFAGWRFATTDYGSDEEG